MSIQVPSPSYGLVAGPGVEPTDPSEAGAPCADGAEKEPRAGPLAGSSGWVPGRSAEPGWPPAEPTTSGDPTHAASPNRQSNAHARATDDLMHHPPCCILPRMTENAGTFPKVRFGPYLAWIGAEPEGASGAR